MKKPKKSRQSKEKINENVKKTDETLQESPKEPQKIDYQEIFWQAWGRPQNEVTNEDKQRLYDLIYGNPLAALWGYIKFKSLYFYPPHLDKRHWVMMGLISFIGLLFIGFLEERLIGYDGNWGEKTYEISYDFTQKQPNYCPVTYFGSFEENYRITYNGFTGNEFKNRGIILIVSKKYYEPSEISQAISELIAPALLDEYQNYHSNLISGNFPEREFIGDSLYNERYYYEDYGGAWGLSLGEILDKMKDELDRKLDITYYIPEQGEILKIKDTTKHIYITPNLKYRIKELVVERQVKGYYAPFLIISRKFKVIQTYEAKVISLDWVQDYIGDKVSYYLTVKEPSLWHKIKKLFKK